MIDENDVPDIEAVRMSQGSINMTKTIKAIYENGVFCPTEAVDLPDRCEVESKFALSRRIPNVRRWMTSFRS